MKRFLFATLTILAGIVGAELHDRYRLRQRDRVRSIMRRVPGG